MEAFSEFWVILGKGGWSLFRIREQRVATRDKECLFMHPWDTIIYILNYLQLKVLVWIYLLFLMMMSKTQAAAFFLCWSSLMLYSAAVLAQFKYCVSWVGVWRTVSAKDRRLEASSKFSNNEKKYNLLIFVCLMSHLNFSKEFFNDVFNQSFWVVAGRCEVDVAHWPLYHQWMRSSEWRSLHVAEKHLLFRYRDQEMSYGLRAELHAWVRVLSHLPVW